MSVKNAVTLAISIALVSSIAVPFISAEKEWTEVYTEEDLQGMSLNGT